MLGLLVCSMLVGLNCGMGLMQILFGREYKYSFYAAGIIFLLLSIQFILYYYK